MTRYHPIWIACPQYRKMVKGSYEVDAQGRYRLGAGGEFLLRRARCGLAGGRCTQTLCVLHKFNRGGAGSWYPEQLVPAQPPSTDGRRKTSRTGDPPAGSTFSIEA